LLGAGDFHEPKYDDIGISSSMTELGKYAIEDSMYSGLPIDEDFCPFTISVYPSQEMEDAYTTNKPLIFALVSAAIFFVTAATFLLYDFCVEKRQKKILVTAVASTALVSSCK
jgi:hypothetical protein